MLKRIALAAVVVVVSAAFAGVGVAKAHSGAKAPTIDATPKAPQGFCPHGFPCG
jgi:hypothetical protein